MRHLRWLWPWVGGLTTLALSVPVLLPGHLIAVDRQWLLVLALVALVSTQLLYQRRIRRVAVHNAARTQSLRFAAVPQWPVWGLLLLTIMSTGIAIDRQAAWEAAGYLLLGLAFYLSLPQLPWLQRRPDGLAWALCLFGIGVLLLAPPLVEWKQEFRLFYVPFYDWFQLIAFDVGETIHANILAGALVPLVTLSAALALPPIQHAVAQVEPDSMRTKYVRIKRRRQERVQQIMAGSLAVCLLILLLLTQSRAAYLGIMVALLFLSILRWRRLRWLLPLLLLGVALQMYQVGLWQSFELLGADNTFGGAEWRTAIWQIAFQAIHDFAYTGIGIGNFRPVLTMLYPHPALTAQSANHAHNLWLQITLDLGIPGLFLYLSLLGMLIWQGLRVVRQRTLEIGPAAGAMVETERRDVSSSQDMRHATPRPGHQVSSRQYRRHLVHLARRHNQNWALTAGAVAALVGIQVHGLLDAVTWGTKFAFLPWLMCALIWLTASSPGAQENYPSHTSSPVN